MYLLFMGFLYSPSVSDLFITTVAMQKEIHKNLRSVNTLFSCSAQWTPLASALEVH